MYIKKPIVQLAKQNREIAIKNGDRFYEGKPCKKAGHTKRYVNVKNPNSHGGCVECSVIRHQKTHVPLEDMTDENVKKITNLSTTKSHGHNFAPIDPILNHNEPIYK